MNWFTRKKKEIVSDERLVEIAIYEDNIESLKKLLKNGVIITDEHFIMACHYNKIKIVKFLINNGTTIKMLSFFIACHWGHHKIVKYLIKKNPSIIYLKNFNNQTALHESCMYYPSKLHLKTIKILIKIGININAVDYNNNTALDYIIQSNRYKIIEYFLKHGGICFKKHIIKDSNIILLLIKYDMIDKYKIPIYDKYKKRHNMIIKYLNFKEIHLKKYIMKFIKI